MAHLAAPLDMGQIAVGVMLGYLDFRQADRDWRSSRRRAAWKRVSPSGPRCERESRR